MGGVMMTIGRSLPYMLVVLICLCGVAGAAEFTLTTGGIVPPFGTSTISNTAPQAGTSGLSIMATSSNPDDYSLKNTLKFDSAAFGLTSESSGGYERQITSGQLNHVHPRVSDAKVVYEEWNAGASTLGMYDIASGNLAPVYPASQRQTYPDVSGRYFVYEQDGSSTNPVTNIYAFDTQTQTARQIAPGTANQNQPAVSGRYVVWQDWRSANGDIYYSDLNSGDVKAISTDLSEQKSPDVSGTYVVWEDWRNGNADIYLYDISSATGYQLTSNKYDQKKPRISGNLVVWEDYRNGGSDIYAMSLENMKEVRLSSETGKAFNPDVSGALVVWEDNRSGNAEIMLLDLITGRIYQVTNDLGDQKNPSIYGANIVWEDYRAGNPNIFLYVIRSPGPGPTPDPGNQYQFNGEIRLDGQVAPVGTQISALIDGKVRAQVQVTSAGQYSGLAVPVVLTDSGKYITFTASVNGASYTASQQVQVTYTGDGGTAIMSAGTPTVLAKGSSQRLDLTCTSSSNPQNYQFFGKAVVDGKSAPIGTVISAMIGSEVRGQTTTDSLGIYTTLQVSIYPADVGKSIYFTASTGGSLYQAPQQVVVSQQVITQLDLSFGSVQPGSQYQFNGNILLDGQAAPVGTQISALINNQVRVTGTVITAGQYAGFLVPVTQADYGKYITFTASSKGVFYQGSQQVQVGLFTSATPGQTTIMSTGSGVSAQGLIQRVDLTCYSSSSTSAYRFYGRANLDGTPLASGRSIYATIDGQIRGQILLTQAGQYGSSSGPYLEVSVGAADIGKTIRFQTDSGAEADLTQLIVSSLTVSKNLNFSSKPSVAADFTATPVQGTAPLSVKFTDKSSGSPKSYFWDFGDGTTSTDRNPVHIYSKDGVYSVGLMTGYWNGGSKSVVKQNYISVGAVAPPNAQIGLNPGWNFISTPKMLSSGLNNAKALFGKIDVGGHSIFTYNPKSKAWSVLSASTVINPLDAIWIYSTRKDTVYLYFAEDALQIPPTKKLSKGWNTFGVTSLNTVQAYNALLSVRDRWVYVIGFDSASQRYQNTIMNVADSAQGLLYPGYGYWLYMNDEGELAAIGI
ncbi:MAG TPA: PKD domain-containing protein [Methanospirillum sp.]|nr:PKD domain-containing protein [Methanospirillum sp.]